MMPKAKRKARTSQNGHDLLSGPEVAAAIAREAAKEKAQPELKPLKIIGQLWGARYNEEGEMIAEEVMGDVRIYAPNFARVEQLVEDAVEHAREVIHAPSFGVRKAPDA
jgi:hypothetical protein